MKKSEWKIPIWALLAILALAGMFFWSTYRTGEITVQEYTPEEEAVDTIPAETEHDAVSESPRRSPRQRNKVRGCISHRDFLCDTVPSSIEPGNR